MIKILSTASSSLVDIDNLFSNAGLYSAWRLAPASSWAGSWEVAWIRRRVAPGPGRSGRRGRNSRAGADHGGVGGRRGGPLGCPTPGLELMTVLVQGPAPPQCPTPVPHPSPINKDWGRAKMVPQCPSSFAPPLRTGANACATGISHLFCPVFGCPTLQDWGKGRLRGACLQGRRT